MAFIEMLSDASLLNLLIEILIIEILKGNVPHFLLQESAEKSNVFCAPKCGALPSVFTFSTPLGNLEGLALLSAATLNICIRPSPYCLTCNVTQHPAGVLIYSLSKKHASYINLLTKCNFAVTYHYLVQWVQTQIFGDMLCHSSQRDALCFFTVDILICYSRKSMNVL